MESNESLPISMVLHTVFCPRRTWLEAAGEESDRSQMAHGHAAHKKVDTPEESRSRRRVSRDVRSAALGIHGRCDSLHLENGSYRLVEHKSTPVRRRAQVTDAQRIQLALQTICLAEESIKVEGHGVHFVDHRKTVDVELSDDDLERARHFVEMTREIIESPRAPAPLVDDRRCSSCSHISVCLPDEHRGAEILRRIHVPDPDSQVLHLTTQGSWVSVKAGRLSVDSKDGDVQTVPLERIHSVVVHGNIDLSGAAIRALAWRNVTIVWCSSSGRIYSWSQPASLPNGQARVRQHVMAERGHLPLAAEIVSSKIANQATMLRRNGDAPERAIALRRLQKAVLDANDLTSLFGLEGEAASIYFGGFSSMLSVAALEHAGFEWKGRRGRGATDEINILLNYAYSLLNAECIRALVACGLDPHAGVLHSSSRNKPAMALDLMEEFRAPIGDSVVLTLINRREISQSDFSSVTGTPRLTTEGRKTLVRAFERRMLTEFRHPVFGYSVTWRRAIEVQARMVLGVIDGTGTKYVGVKIR